MGYYVYILHSEKNGRYYIGYTGDIETRLDKHNFGSTKSTKSGIPWKMVYYEIFKDKKEAIQREKSIKRMKSRKYIESLILNMKG